MGADNGIHVELPETADNNLAAKALAGALKKEAKVDISLPGKEAIDDGAAQSQPTDRRILRDPLCDRRPQCRIRRSSVKCKREIEGGAFEMVESPLPGSHRGTKRSERASLCQFAEHHEGQEKRSESPKMADVGVSEADQKIRYKNFQLPPPKQAGKKITGEPAAQAKELVRLLHEEAKVV